MDTFEIKDDEINVDDLMHQIRENVKKRREGGIFSSDMDSLVKIPMQVPTIRAEQEDDLQNNIDFINSKWNVHAKEYSISSHRPLLGHFLVRGRQLIHGEVRRYVDVIAGKQAEFNNHIAISINKLKSRLDKIEDNRNRDTEGLEENIQELDGKIGKVENELDGKIGKVEKEFDGKINKTIDEKIARIFATINNDIENKAWLANLLEKRIKFFQQSNANETDSKINYFTFNEDIGKAWNRLSGDSIQEAPNIFDDSLKIFRGCKNVLDVGCGVGTLLQKLKDSGIGGYGIDINDDFILYCKRKGFNVEKVDALTHLKSLQDKTLDGVFAAHVIEHMQLYELERLIELCYAKMQFGSYIILVTPNILNVIVSTNTFYMDPTHVNHLHPEVIKFLLESRGFRDIQEGFYQPIPNDVKLKKFNCDADSNIEQKNICETMNRNIDILNNLLFGYRDIAVIAKK